MLKNSGTKTIKTERLILRKFKMSDAKGFYDNVGSDENVTKYVSWHNHENIDVTKKVIEKWISNYKNDYNYNWIIELKDSKEIIGTMTVVHVDYKNKTCEIGYVISSIFWNMGYGTEALKCVINYLIEEGFKTIYAEYQSKNPASGRIMEKAGMKYEATLKNRIIDKTTGEYDDLLSYSLIVDN